MDMIIGIFVCILIVGLFVGAVYAMTWEANEESKIMARRIKQMESENKMWQRKIDNLK